VKTVAGKVALIAGAASGIGRAAALALARGGAGLILADISAPGLQEARAEVDGCGPCLLTEIVDVSNREQMEAFAERVRRTVPGVDILVNSAGVYLTGGVLDLTLEDWQWSLAANLWGMIHTVHCFVPGMVERGRGGHVVNLASMYGYWPAPGVIGYLTAKFAVFGFSEALREDLRAYRIGVSTVCPGIVHTRLIDNMRFRGGSEEKRRRLAAFYERRSYGPERVARAILTAIRRNRKLVLVSPEARIMYHMQRFCPPLSCAIARAAAKRMFS
jgi:NAD(P)-dependent dehydrogenase (short-subunit alcohol dehydrogenase family)